MLRLRIGHVVALGVAITGGAVGACSLAVDTGGLTGGGGVADTGPRDDSSVSDTAIDSGGSDTTAETSVDDADAAIDSTGDTTPGDAPSDQGPTDAPDAGPAPVVTVTGSSASGSYTVEVAGKFRLVFERNNAWQPTNWFDLASDPSASQDLANKSYVGNDPFLVDPGQCQDTASNWLGATDGTNPTIVVSETGPTRAVLKTEYTLNQAVPPASGLPCKTALLTTIYDVYASGRIAVDSSLTNEDTVTCTLDNFLFGDVSVESSLDWSVAEYLTKYGFSFARTSGIGPRPAILGVAHTVAVPFGLDNDGPYDRFWTFGYSTIGAGGTQVDRYELELLDDQTPASFADRVDDLRNPGLTVVSGATPSSSTSYDTIQGAYDVGATATTVSLYPTSAFTRYAPSFVIESWTSPTFTISLAGVTLATNASHGPDAVASYDATKKILLFEYLGAIDPSASTAARTFTITP